MRSVYESKKDEFWRNQIAEKLWCTLNRWARRPATTPVFILPANLLHSSATKLLKPEVRSSTAIRRRCIRRPAQGYINAQQLDRCDSRRGGYKLIGLSLNKTCQLDPVTWLVKDMSGILAPFVALLFNRSLVTRCFQSDFKRVVVRPLFADDTQLYLPVKGITIGLSLIYPFCPSCWRG